MKSGIICINFYLFFWWIFLIFSLYRFRFEKSHNWLTSSSSPFILVSLIFYLIILLFLYFPHISDLLKFGFSFFLFDLSLFALFLDFCRNYDVFMLFISIIWKPYSLRFFLIWSWICVRICAIIPFLINIFSNWSKIYPILGFFI